MSDDSRDSLITFTVVAEPPESESDEKEECIDLGFGQINLRKIASNESDVETTFDIPMWDIQGEFEIGKLTVSFKGLNFIQSLIESEHH